MSLSVSIISFNEEHNIGRTLESIKDIADEIIIVDSFSTDNTLEIAKKYNARVFQFEWQGHIAQKNIALNLCTSKWILCLDCDEVVSKKLLNSIIKAIQTEDNISYKINRKTFYIDKLLEYAWQPDWNLRLVRKDSNPNWTGLNPHDFLESNSVISKLEGDIIHYSYKDMKQHFSKTVDYAYISANSYHKKGKKFKFSNLLLNPIIAFIRLYFINKGIFDGIYGFIAATSSFIGTFLKYAFLWEIERKNN